MKHTLLLCALAVSVNAAQPVLVRVTPERLAELQARDPMIRLVRPEDDTAKVVRTKDESIIKASTVLHDGKNWTIVPKGSLVHLPDSLKSRVDAKPVGHILSWKDFLARNQSWITTSEVTFEQAAGSKPISPETSRLWAGENKMVVAVREQGPISVRMATTHLTNR